MQDAIRHLQEALRELQDKVARQTVSPDAAAEAEQRLLEISARISEIERKLEASRRPDRRDADGR